MHFGWKRSVAFATCVASIACAHGQAIDSGQQFSGHLIIAEFLPVLLTGLIVAFYLAFAVREFGRLIGCRLIGWDIYLFRVWPLLVRFEPFAVRLGGIPGKFAAAWVLAFPPTPEKQTKLRVAVFNRSGAVTNFIFIIAILVVLAVALPRSVAVSFVLLAFALFFTAIFSLFTFQKDEPLSHFDIARLRATALRVSGIMPGKWDSTLVETLETGAGSGAVETDATLRSVDVFLYEHYFDLGEYKEAREALNRAISRTRPSDRAWDGCCIENAFFSAFIARNVPLAEDSLAKVKNAKLRRYDHYRQALAAIAIARGDGAEALRLLQRVHRFRYSFAYDFERRIHAQVVCVAQRLASP
jgi:hypothetical protein